MKTTCMKWLFIIVFWCVCCNTQAQRLGSGSTSHLNANQIPSNTTTNNNSTTTTTSNNNYNSNCNRNNRQETSNTAQKVVNTIGVAADAANLTFGIIQLLCLLPTNNREHLHRKHKGLLITNNNDTIQGLFTISGNGSNCVVRSYDSN